MIEDIVFCSETDASCVSAELKKLGFTVVSEQLSVNDRQIINKVSPVRNIAKFRISNGPWGILMRISGKIKTERGLNFYNS